MDEKQLAKYEQDLANKERELMLKKKEKDIDERFKQITSKPSLDEDRLKSILIKVVIVLAGLAIAFVLIKRFI